MSSTPKSLQEQKNSLLRKLYKEKIWPLFLREENFSAIKGDEIFKEVAANLVKIEKQRPSYIPQKFYKTVVWHRHIAEENVARLNTNYEGNKILKAMETDKISYLSNLVSSDPELEDFYVKNGSKSELLLHIHCLFETLAEWPYEFKTSGSKDAAIVKGLRKNLSKCANLITESPDVRFNLQMRWESHVRKIMDCTYEHDLTAKGIEIKKASRKLFSASIFEHGNLIEEGLIKEGSITRIEKHIDLLHTFNIMVEYLTEIEPLAAKKSSYVKKIHAEDAVIHYAARKLKELFEEYRVPKRQNIKYINDLINVVMKEKTTEDRIRKLVS